MKGWSGSIACCHRTAWVPRLQAVVSSAQPVVPFGKAPTRPRCPRSSRSARNTSMAGFAFCWAESAPPARRTTRKDRVRFIGSARKRRLRRWVRRWASQGGTLPRPREFQRNRERASGARSWAVRDRVAEAHEEPVGELEVAEQDAVAGDAPDHLNGEDPAL